ncbi:MAG: hypothetical protein HC836_46850 [Richelia sp. RM2_1_2]|nr:hypothetical protein [Richelia sp. RM2_1_2]
MNKQKQYIELARKLGKLPSRREVRNLLGYYIDEFGNFKKDLLKNHPELSELDTPVKLTDKDIENYRLSKHKSNTKSVNAKKLVNTSNLNYIEQFAKSCFSGKVKNKTKRPENFIPSRTHTLVLSDLHIGSDIDSSETGSVPYGKVEEARRLAYVVSETIEYKKQYKNQTHLEVLIIGDIIDGLLHDARSGAVLAEQFARAIHLLSQAITQLALVYPTVAVRCATGNHGRNTARHKERAVMVNLIVLKQCCILL